MIELQKFFLFCSGANHSVLTRTPTEINKFVGIGATIFFTGLFAALASGYAIYTVFNSYFFALIFGLLWGFMIFNLDRYIVSTIKKKGRFLSDFFNILPRLGLAVLIAVVIAKPLELKIFDSEIQSELVTMQQENYKRQEAVVHDRFEADLGLAKSEMASLKNEIKIKTAQRDQLAVIANAEADGTGGSQLRNMGPIYRAKKADADLAQVELTALEVASQPLINSKLDKIQSLESRRTEALTGLRQVGLTGFAARLDALDRISQRSEAIYLASLFIMLLFIAIETAPIFVKLITPRSPYDYVLDKHEHAFAMNHKSVTTSLSTITKNEIEFLVQTNKHKTDLAIKGERDLANQAIAEHIEKLKQQPMQWRELLRKGKLYGLE